MINKIQCHVKTLDQRGSFMAAILLITIILVAIGVSLTEVVVTQYSHTKRSTFVANALLVAEAGIEKSLAEMNNDPGFNGFTAQQEFFNSEGQGRGVYTSVVESVSGDSTKVVTATGQVYRVNDTVNPVSTRKVKVTIVGTESEGYSVFTGPGGLLLSGSANITNSDVFVNGYIDLSGAAKIGTYNQPVNVNVAHQVCPPGNAPGTSYPAVCGNGDAITMAYSTNIYGTVCATGQTSTGPNNNIQAGSTGQGLQIGCVTPPVSQPSYDRAAHIARMTSSESASDRDFDCSKYKNPVGFTRTWPANLQLNGNVKAASSCDLTITGDVYITGDLTIGGAAKIKVADSVGTDRPVVVVDGNIDVGGSGQLIANASGTGVQFISFKSSASCSPSCTNLTGNDLKQTQDLLTVDVGGAANLPGMVFQAYWGRVKIGGSGSVGAAIGQTVDLRGAGTVTFGTKLSSGSKTWTVTSYQQVFD